jgi:predicted YcjX-like family ATPase
MDLSDTGRKGLNALKSGIGSVGSYLSDQIQKPTEVRLAVTGLSRAGKTVFVTSMLSNLVAYAKGAQVLHRLDAMGLKQRIVSIEEMAPDVSPIARFPYSGHLEAMAADDPTWPDRTSDITEIIFEIRLSQAESLKGRLLGDRVIRLIVSDYPGEWLLDLPLLKQSFRDWSHSMHVAMTSGTLRNQSKRYLELLASINPNAQAADEKAKQLHVEYKKMLIDARDKEGSRFLQPGRFTCPGPWGDVPLLWFSPLPVPVANGEVAKGSLFALMERRFEAYKADMEEKFFKPVFAKVDRQIILVDVLGALCAGQDAFRDTTNAIIAITQAIAQDNSSWFSWLRPKAGTVVLAATKADHVPERQREALGILLKSMVGDGLASSKGSTAKIETCALASIQCTRDDTAELDGRPVAVVSGVPLGKDRLIKFFPGEVPLSIPEPKYWEKPYFDLPKFKPPKIDVSGKTGIPHTNIDLALKILLGGII